MEISVPACSPLATSVSRTSKTVFIESLNSQNELFLECRYRFHGICQTVNKNYGINLLLIAATNQWMETELVTLQS